MKLSLAIPSVLILGAAAYGAVALYGAHQRSIGRLQSQIHVLDSTNKVLGKHIKQQDIAYTADTATFRKQLGNYEAQRTSLLQQLARRPIVRPPPGTPPLVRDTVHDTIPVEPLLPLPDSTAIRNFIHAADSTIAACSVVVLNCEQRVAQRDSVIASQAMKITKLSKRDKLFGLFPAPSRTLMLGLGLAGGYLLAK